MIVYSKKNEIKLLEGLFYIREKMVRLEMQGKPYMSDKQFEAYQTLIDLLVETADNLEKEKGAANIRH